MSAPPPPTPSAAPETAGSSTGTGATAGAGASKSKAEPAPKIPLTGFKASLEHTGIPRSVLTWKPRLPSRNWSIFLTVTGSIFYLYYDDRRECKRIKDETLRKVDWMGKEPLREGSLGELRKVKVYGARAAEDGDDDRALRYFRKYVKPYLVAAAIEYEQLSPPLIHGSVARHIHGDVLSRRRQKLGLEPAPLTQSFPGAMDPAGQERRELEGGTVLVGRASLKEYMEGLRRGWTGGAGEWSLEGDVKRRVERDGVFDLPLPLEEPIMTGEIPTEPDVITPPASTPKTSSPIGGLGFLSRPPAPAHILPADPSTPPAIPTHFHTPPSVPPPQPPLLLLPFTNHLGFKQFPNMIYDFFTERKKVQQGADAALALIFGKTREFRGPSASRGVQDQLSEFSKDTGDEASSASTSTSTAGPAPAPASGQGGDLDFDLEGESYIRKSFKEFPGTLAQTRKDYYAAFQPRLEHSRAIASGEKELNADEQSGKTKWSTEEELRDERVKKEMRWMGGEDGYEIVRPDRGVVWQDNWEGWLKVFVKPDEEDMRVPPNSSGPFEPAQ